MGPALVSLQNGQMEVIGLLHRQSDSLGQISAAVDQVLTGQQAIAGSLNMLTTLSMVGLGVSVLSHVALSFQLIGDDQADESDWQRMSSRFKP